MNHIKEIAIKAVETVTGITFDEMNSLGPNGKISRKNEHVTGRRFICALLYENHVRLSLKEIGDVFNGQDHSTIINALRKHDNYIATDKNYNEVWFKVREEFKSKKSAFDSKELLNSEEYRNHVKDTLKRCMEEGERCLDIIRNAVLSTPPTAQDLGFSVVNLNE